MAIEITAQNAAFVIEVLEIDLAEVKVKITASQRSFHSQATAALVAEKRQLEARIEEARKLLVQG